LDPEDYAWTTRRIMEVADICCQGRVVSVLEGGYGRTPLRESNRVSSKISNNADSADGGTTATTGESTATATVPRNMNLLDKSVFSESAMRHLRALIDPHDAEQRHPRQQMEGDDENME
jgi:uncharacterized protein (DUF2342 family)